MSELCTGSWFVAFILLHTQRTDRRLIARAPLLGAGLLLTLIAGYTAWRIIFRPGPIDAADGAFVRGTLALCSGFALPLVLAWLRALLLQDLPRLARALRQSSRWTRIYLLLGLSFTLAYFLYGREFGLRGVFDKYDVLFDADPLYEQQNYGAEIHTHTHPLLPLIWYVGSGVTSLFTGLRWAPLVLNSAIAGLSVVVSALYFRSVSRSGLLGLLAAVILAITSSHLVFSSLPESWILAALSLMLLQLFVARRSSPALRLRHVVLASVLATGVTITNVAAALVCFLFWQYRRPTARRRWSAYIRWATYCLTIGAFALGLQMVIRPAAEPLQVAHYLDETRFVETAVPLTSRIAKLAHGLFIQNVVGFLPSTGRTYGQQVVTASSSYDRLGVATAIIWVGLALAAAWLLLRNGRWRQRSLGAAATCLALSAGLFAFYGLSNVFLYSCSFTLYVFAILAHSLAGQKPARIAAILAAFAALLAFNNARFAARLIALLDELGCTRG